jgi:CrcB protein
MVQTFAAFSNLDGQPRSGVHDVRPSPYLASQPQTTHIDLWRNLALQAADGIAQIVITLAVSAFSLAFGRRLALYLPSICLHGNPQIATTSSIRPTRIVVGILCCATYLSAILALGLSRRDWPGHRVLFALVLAPPGTILRWWLARVLNTQSTRFPTSGTLAANFLATAVLAVGYLLQRIVPLGQGLSPIGCQALQAVEDGFCGSLSTISTFVTELDALSSRSIDELERLRATGNGEPSARRRMGLVEREALWLYVGASVVLGQALVVLILGVGWWASPRGVGPVCRFAR